MENKLLPEEVVIDLEYVLAAIEESLDSDRSIETAGKLLLDKIVEEFKGFDPEEPFELHTLRGDLNATSFELIRVLVAVFSAAHNEMTARCATESQQAKRSISA
jgi:hypothetical protein